ncbi:proteasome assembly chaperone family protein [Halosegnis sp.]|uniref:proteasome assembly chaperone family protein n=1 Tax=Halosegnis sp. TaxID=2864959 RepID=UPI0035D46B84
MSLPFAPFEGGTPRRHTRLFAGDGGPAALLGELPVPPAGAESFGQAVVGWADEADLEEVVFLSGVPVAHGPDDHRAFYIASEGYQTRHDLSEVAPMLGGFLDGVTGAVTAAGMDHDVDTCVFTTPVHAQSPDAEAALRLLDGFAAVHNIAVDTDPLRAFADELARHYAELAERVNREEPAADDRMYM